MFQCESYTEPSPALGVHWRRLNRCQQTNTPPFLPRPAACCFYTASLMEDRAAAASHPLHIAIQVRCMLNSERSIPSPVLRTVLEYVLLGNDGQCKV
ncbi:UNVERIFIED_CONTAM: hypothetical protein FKN15_049741 [Acipenser sinensis]